MPSLIIIGPFAASTKGGYRGRVSGGCGIIKSGIAEVVAAAAAVAVVADVIIVAVEIGRKEDSGVALLKAT